jgi:hypothetical protein
MQWRAWRIVALCLRFQRHLTGAFFASAIASGAARRCTPSGTSSSAARIADHRLFANRLDRAPGA